MSVSQLRGADAASLPSARLWRTLLVVCALLIVYGSLYPFAYAPPASVADAWDVFISDGTVWTSSGDIAGNIVLFVPFGAAGIAAMPQPADLGRRAALLAGGTVFAFAVQAMQIWFPPRDAALADVWWNAAGTVIGMAVASLVARYVRPIGTAGLPREAVLALALLALWALTQWAPLIPTLDWQAIKDSLKPLLLDPVLDPAASMLTFARVLAVGCLVAAIPGPSGSAPVRLILFLAVMLAGKLFIVGQQLSLSTVLGYAGGCAAWLVLTGRRHSTGATALLLLAAYSVAALAPFDIRDEPSTFHLLPFEALLEGSMETNSRALLDAAFVYGALLWLVQRAGARVLGSSIVLALWVGGIEYLQVWIQGRTGDITEPLLVLAIGVLIRAVCRPAGRHAPRTRRSRTHGRH